MFFLFIFNVKGGNKYVTFVSRKTNENIKYEVFSIYQIEKEDYYIQTNFNGEDAYNSFLNTITNRSVKDFNVDITTDDEILTLSTCANDNTYRVVLHARRVVE